MNEQETAKEVVNLAELTASLAQENAALKAALKELVALKTIAEQCDKSGYVRPGEYYTRKPLAWAQARKLLEGE